MIRTYAYKDIKIEEIFAREEEKTNVADVVAEIIAEVRKGGDAALKRYAEQFDGAAPVVRFPRRNGRRRMHRRTRRFWRF